MNRDIKFRAWDKVNSKFRDIESIIIGRNNKPTSIVSNGDFYQIQSNNQIELMQYTGLKDKNGVEIYEGDILKGVNGSINGRGWNWGAYEVKYNEQGLHDVPTKWGSENNHDSTHWFEVIGNTYESPELLGEQK